MATGPRAAATVTLESRVVLSSAQVSTTLGTDVVMLGLERNEYYGLGEVGALIHRHLRAPHRVADLVPVILDTFDVDAARCAADLLVVMRDLVCEGLVDVLTGDA